MSQPQRRRLLVFGYLPPPYFGPSVAYHALMRSEFARHFDVTFIDVTVVTDISELETVRIAKLFGLFRFASTEMWYLLTRRFDFCCCPVSFNRNAFLKDALLLGLARLFCVPTVLWAHNTNFPDFHSCSPRWLQRLIDTTVRNAAGVIVLGERLRVDFQQFLPAERIFAVHLGVEPAPPLSPVQKRSDRITAVFLGNLIREKGVFVLLEAFALIVPSRPDVHCVFAGAWRNEDDHEETERIVREQCLSRNVEFVGVVTGETKWQTLAQSDIFCLPTFHPLEAHPNALLEALQAGLPVVTTARGAIPEIIEDGVNGLLVEEQNPRDLADKILQLATDGALRQRISLANREKFATLFTHEHYGRRMIAVFETLGHAQ